MALFFVCRLYSVRKAKPARITAVQTTRLMIFFKEITSIVVLETIGKIFKKSLHAAEFLPFWQYSAA